MFKRSVIAQQSAYTEQLSLYPPVFEDDGFITTAFMSSYSGKVELRCGPAEYHVELFVHDDPGVNRRTLSELIALPIVREWMKNRLLKVVVAATVFSVASVALLIVRTKAREHDLADQMAAAGADRAVRRAPPEHEQPSHMSKMSKR